MFVLKEFQEEAVQNLLHHTIEALQEQVPQTPILLEAPTGSGKTVMMAALIERIVEELPLRTGQLNDVAFIWIAPNTLHIQSYHSLKSLYEDANKLHCVDLDEMSDNPQLNSRELLFVNWSKINSVNNVWRTPNEKNINIETLVENTRADGLYIILIIDEAHLDALTGRQAIEVRRLIKADVEIMVTATPNERPARTVAISRRKVIGEQMIKKGVRINIGLNPAQQNGDNVHIHLLRKAFEKKAELQALFNRELGEGVINPLILIQLPSENQTLSNEDKSLRDTLQLLLENEYDISTANGRLAIWLSEQRDKDGLEDMNGLQDVLIFKQAIAQGWDCPRASVLVSYRKIDSPQFGIQTVGRILRMPHHRHYNNDNLNYGYVYSNIQTNQIIFKPSDEDYFDKQIAERQIRTDWTFESMTKSIIVNDRPAPGLLTSAFESLFFEVVRKRYAIEELPDVDLFNIDNEAIYKEQKESNKRALVQNGWEFEIDVNQIAIPADMEADPYEVNAIIVNTDQVRHFAITTAQFYEIFNKFCYDSVTRLNRSKSWKKLRETLIHFAEYYLAMFETDAIKFFLYPQNRPLLVQLITHALEQFDEWQRAKGNKNRRVEEVIWEVPQVRYFNHLYKNEDIPNHALLPFFELNNASSVEKAFKHLLIENAEHITWWYKNGDSGKEHFSVHYTNSQNELRLFFVDFIIKFKSGKIGLFDTKTMGFDAEAPNKHYALLEYIERENLKLANNKFIGGIIIPTDNAGVVSFRYPLNRITDTNDLRGWEFFNPATINNS
jgi:type III restriction enzyme